eukprot:scaffold33011_cov73-Isochrysis_galbana.AAC.2
MCWQGADAHAAVRRSFDRCARVSWACSVLLWFREMRELPPPTLRPEEAGAPFSNFMTNMAGLGSAAHHSTTCPAIIWPVVYCDACNRQPTNRSCQHISVRCAETKGPRKGVTESAGGRGACEVGRLSPSLLCSCLPMRTEVTPHPPLILHPPRYSLSKPPPTTHVCSSLVGMGRCGPGAVRGCEYRVGEEHSAGGAKQAGVGHAAAWHQRAAGCNGLWRLRRRRRGGEVAGMRRRAGEF